MARISGRGRPSFQYLKPALLKIQNVCSTCALIVCLILLVLSLLAVAFKPLNKKIHVVLIDDDKPSPYTTDTKFLSIALDSSLIARSFAGFNLTNQKLVNLMKPLAPGYLRIGGTMADRLWFVTENTFIFKNMYAVESDGGRCAYEELECDRTDRPNFTMTDLEWLQLNNLAKRSGLVILFDLNSLIRNPDGSWNSKNAEKLIKFSDDHGLNVIWELGNEPTLFREKFNYEVNATQMAIDFKKLKNILYGYPRYKNSLLVGPDVNRPVIKHNKSEIYLETFLKVAGRTINAVTWHQYYFNGRTATSSDFLNYDIFDVLKKEISLVKDTVRHVGLHGKPIWLGETSSAYGGGAPGLSNRYIATFIWLDKLGLSANNGIDLVVRQAFYSKYYGLIYDDLEPTPDWWISVLYKTLVGPEVVPCHSMSSKMVRLYCHCAQKKSLYNVMPSVTVFGFNMKSTEAKIRIDGYESQALAYVLTPYVTLLSKYILLNEEILYLQPNGDLPVFKPRVVNSKPYLTIPPYGLVFWIIPAQSIKYCHSAIEPMDNM